VDTAGCLLVYFEDLADDAVLSVCSVRAGVFEFQAVLVDALAGRAGIGNELLRADDEDDVGGARGVGAAVSESSRDFPTPGSPRMTSAAPAVSTPSRSEVSSSTSSALPSSRARSLEPIAI
jgi:hypothetical protein